MRPSIAVAAAVVASMSTIALAADVGGQSVYRPVTSDLMNTVIQPRHIKLWLAGRAQNWEYADYERHNIGGALHRLAEAIPTYKGQSMSALVEAFATPELDALDTAIKAKDPVAFKRGYENLTTGCNQCHQATGHAMIVMQTPAADAFPDQAF
jgi:hypothetical protein